MRNASDINNSIRAVSQTSQITNAMKLISTSKMQKANARYEANRIYFDRVRSALKDILTHSRELHHTFLEKHESGIPAYVVIAADKGLAGAYNHNVLNFAFDKMPEGDKFVISIGQETRAFFSRKKIPIDVEYLHVAQNPTLYETRRLVEDISKMYKEGIMSEVNLIYTRYFSTVKQKPVSIKLLPVELTDFDDVKLETEYGTELDYHPSASQVFDTLVPQYIVGLVYGAVVQAYASENSARMVAMDNASRNASEMMSRLSIEMNHARQYAVTREITEIVGALDAMAEEE